MIGFEAELNVPTFEQLSPEGMAGGFQNIYSFLFGGYTNTDDEVGGNSFVKIKPDVADFTTFGKSVANAISPFSNIKEFMTQKKKEVLITKLEYETTPVTETNPGSDEAYSEQATFIKNHSSQFTSQAKEQVVEVPEPAKGMWAGVPVAEIMVWINPGRKHEKQQARDLAETLNTALTKIKARVRDEFAIQATAGIFPSMIPKLFEDAQKPLDQPSDTLGKAWAIAYPQVVLAIQNVLTQPAIKNHGWMQALPNDDVCLQAFKGHLYLLFSYLVGDALSLSSLFKDMSGKNAVPYHAKINLGHVHKAMPEGLREPLPRELAQEIAKVLAGQECTNLNFWLRQNLGLTGPREDKEHLVFDTHEDFVSLALTGKPVRTLINQNLGLAGQAKQREHLSPDQEPRSMNDERGVQLEFRRLGMNQVAPDELANKFMTVVNRVRELNKPRMA